MHHNLACVQDEAAYLSSRASSVTSSLDLEVGAPRRLSGDAARAPAAALSPAQQQQTPFAAAAARLQQQQQPNQDALVSIPEDGGHASADLDSPAAQVGRP